MEETLYRYKAFISYSHKDQKFAKWLHKKIENYKIPHALREKYPHLPKDLKRTMFIDDEELPTADALPDNLSNALESSELLIVVCSPSATQSYWVDKEIAYFKHHHGEGKVLAVLNDGEPNATHSTLYENDLEAFPKSLRYTIDVEGNITDERTEPLAADARKRGGRKKALLKLIAGILKVDFADLWEREKKETRKRRFLFGTFFALFIAITLYASVQFWGEKGNKELEQLKQRISVIEYSIRHDNLEVAKVIALNKELKKLKKDKENKEASQKALGKLKTSLGKKANEVYRTKGAQSAIDILSSQKALANQESRLKEISKEKLALARLYEETYQFDKAEENYKMANDLFFDYENGNNYAYFLLKQNNTIKAISAYKKILKQNLSKIDKANVFNALGVVYSDINKFDKSEERYLESLKIVRALAKQNPDTDTLSLTQTLGNLANLYNDTNRYKKAEEAYLEALKIYRIPPQENSKAYTINLGILHANLANLYQNVNRYKESEDHYLEALKLLPSHPIAYAITLGNLGGLYRVIIRYEKSEDAYLDALLILREAIKINPNAYKPEFAKTLGDLAIVYSTTNRYKKAEEASLASLKIFRALVQQNPDAYTPSLALTLGNLAELYRDAKRYEKSEEAFLESVQIVRALAKQNPNTYTSELARTLGNLALLYNAINQYEKSKESFKEALEIYRTLAKQNPDEYNKYVDAIVKQIEKSD